MTLQGRTKLKMWLVLVAVFVLGSVTGVALTGLYRSRAAGRNRRLIAATMKAVNSRPS